MSNPNKRAWTLDELRHKENEYHRYMKKQYDQISKTGVLNHPGFLDWLSQSSIEETLQSPTEDEGQAIRDLLKEETELIRQARKEVHDKHPNLFAPSDTEDEPQLSCICGKYGDHTHATPDCTPVHITEEHTCGCVYYDGKPTKRCPAHPEVPVGSDSEETCSTGERECKHDGCTKIAVMEMNDLENKYITRFCAKHFVEGMSAVLPDYQKAYMSTPEPLPELTEGDFYESFDQDDTRSFYGFTTDGRNKLIRIVNKLSRGQS